MEHFLQREVRNLAVILPTRVLPWASIGKKPNTLEGDVSLLELTLVILNDVPKTNMVCNEIILLVFAGCRKKECPRITVMNSLVHQSSVHLHLDGAGVRENDKYAFVDVCARATSGTVLAVTFLLCREIGVHANFRDTEFVLNCLPRVA